MIQHEFDDELCLTVFGILEVPQWNSIMEAQQIFTKEFSRSGGVACLIIFSKILIMTEKGGETR